MAVLTSIVVVADSDCVTAVPSADAANWPRAKVVPPLPGSKAIALLVASADETAAGRLSAVPAALVP